MFIRFENADGEGIYQSDFLEDCYFFDVRCFFDFMGGVTRAPKQYRGSEPGHQCRGVDVEFEYHMNKHTRFAWKLDFFKDMASGKWTPEQSEVASRFNWTPITNKEQFASLITTLGELGMNVIVLKGEPIYQTEQQVLFNPDDMELIDCLGVDDVQLLMD